MAARPNVSPFATPMMPPESEEGISFDGEGSMLHKTCLFQTVLECILFLFFFEICTTYDVFIMMVKGVKYAW